MSDYDPPLFKLSPAQLAAEYPALERWGKGLLASAGNRCVSIRKGAGSLWATREDKYRRHAAVAVETREQLEAHLAWAAGEVG